MENDSVLNTIIQGDTLEEMHKLDDGSIDMILADLPYGTTACKWDTIIPFEELWAQYERLIKDNGAIVLTASQPFTSALAMSNPNLFRYAWVWEKSKCGNFQIARHQPLKYTEDILVFSKNRHNYYPIMRDASPSTVSRRKYAFSGESRKGGLNHMSSGKYKYSSSDFGGKINPSNLIYFKSEFGLHPTQKPVALFEYLIRTYTNERETVLDNVIGSGTTAVAAINTGRNFIGIEREQEYVDIARRRADEARAEKEAK